MTPTLTGSAARAECAASTSAAAMPSPDQLIRLRFDLASMRLPPSRSFLQRHEVAFVDRCFGVHLRLDHALAPIPSNLALDILDIEPTAFVHIAQHGLQRFRRLLEIFGEDGEDRRRVGALAPLAGGVDESIVVIVDALAISIEEALDDIMPLIRGLLGGIDRAELPLHLVPGESEE